MAMMELRKLRQMSAGPQGAQNHNSRIGGQIMRICVEIYLKIDKMVKMYKNSY